MIRITSIGMIKVLCNLPKETLQNIQSLEMEVFHQMVLCAQEAKNINEKNYKGANITKMGNAFILYFRKRYDEEIPKFCPSSKTEW